MKGTRIWAQLIILALTVSSVLAGCQAGGRDQDATGIHTVDEYVLGNGESAEAAINNEEKPKLKALLPVGGALVWDIATGPAYEAIVEKTGYELEIDAYQPAEAETTINMAMASRADYDIIRGGTPTMWFNYIANNAAAPLDDSLRKYGSDVMGLFPEEVWSEMTMDDGKIYGIPTMVNPRIWNTTAIRTDWLEALEMDTPTTLEEFVEILRAFKEQDPGGVGRERCIPFSTSVFAADAIDYDPFLGAFGITYPWNERDGKLVHRVELPEFREYVEFYRQLYSDGLLDADIAVNKDDVMQEKVNQGLVGLVRYNYYYANLTWDLWEAAGVENKLDFIPNPVGSNGRQGQQVDTTLDINIFVPANSNNADHVINYANLFAQNYEYLLIGEEGIHWRMEDNRRTPILPIFNDERGDVFFYQPVMSSIIEYPLWMVRVNKVPNQGRAYADVMKSTEGYVQENPLAFALNLPKTSKNAATLEKMINDTVLRIVVGDLPLEELDNLTAQWKAQGGDESTMEVNAWYRK